MSQALEELLEGLAGEGSFDSSDRFSLDWFRAQRLSLLFTRKSSFLLKLVQCAHLCGSPRLQINRRGPRLEVYFPCPKVTPRMLHQRSSLVLEQGRQCPLDALIGAVRAAAQEQPRTLWWGVCGPQGGLGYRLQDQEIVVQPLGGHGQSEFECFFVIERSPEPWWRSWRGYWSDLLDDAWLFSGFSSVLIELDGKPRSPTCPGRSQGKVGKACLPWLCDRIYLARESCWELLTLPRCEQMQAVAYALGTEVSQLHTRGQAQTFLQQWRGYSGGEPPLFEPLSLGPITPQVEFSGVTPAFAHLMLRPIGRDFPYTTYVAPLPKVTLSNTLWGQSHSLCARCWMRIPSRPRHKLSRLHWIQHGVCLEPVELELPLSDVEVYLADPHQATDVSGFQAVKDARWWQVQHWLGLELALLPGLLYRVIRGLEPRQRVPPAWVKQTIYEQNLDRSP